ncbi:NYN domain-containing protein [Caballeronia sp. ATUFL_M1_KS5A]|uniref:NYN domain-containing protein n=1 Tax=Caballeronia sp. ATUFL_M1_KS5A TaxID=2921778 RepID=UPI0020287AE4|nr:NYN domain-containing protein [Caballeronia sp. ATUFL_M1_KS5A]
MDRVAVFVDAGHLYAGGSAALSGEKKKRTEITLNVAKVATYLQERATALSGLPLLRIYWYDGAIGHRLTTEQQLLASTDNIKLRLGVVNGVGEQKGVDAKIVTDLAELARNCAACDAVLVGGDEDLRLGVELAQERGVRVHLLTIEQSGVSPLLRREADTTSVITVADLKEFMTVNPSAPPVAKAMAVPANQMKPTPSRADASSAAVGQAAPSATEIASNKVAALIKSTEQLIRVVDVALVVTEYLGSISAPEKAALSAAVKAEGSIPREHDGKILARARDSVERQLEPAEKTELRRQVRAALNA